MEQEQVVKKKKTLMNSNYKMYLCKCKYLIIKTSCYEIWNALGSL